ncbi:MAG TPA: vanadium-dependent haloperoxidase, partial [Pyrinomonadaceae bacterium]|nr:vanadium-dependent haloperoxidase [Pyrinomonadaceae bacterium]
MGHRSNLTAIAFVALSLLVPVPFVRADSVSEWNTRACDIVGVVNYDTPTSNRVLAIMHTAIYEAVNAITKKYPAGELKLNASGGASVDAAVAGASRAVLIKLVPAKAIDVELVFKKVMDAIPDGQSKTLGLSAGERAAAAILAARAEDGFATVESYRPYTIAGVYVPTALPAVSQWPLRKPWVMTSPTQFRPGPPPDLKSAQWARDYNEIKAIGGKTSSTRTVEQTNIARFWEATGPVIYHGLVKSVADSPGRDVTRNARLFMVVTQATDDAMIAIFDAKYQYKFWRPITAIRNGDIDGNDATERDPSWTPFINTPMHPEYPCAHCIVSGAIGTVLEADIGSGGGAVLST